MSTPEPAPMSDHCENMAAEGGAAAMEHIMTPDGQMLTGSGLR